MAVPRVEGDPYTRAHIIVCNGPEFEQAIFRTRKALDAERKAEAAGETTLPNIHLPKRINLAQG